METPFRHESWSSRLAFILAAVGAAVGLGNVWKFPYMAGTNGGGAFVIVYLACVAGIALPILMAELLIGRRGHQSPPAAMRLTARAEGRSGAWALVGWLGVAAGFVIVSFYSVIGGWVLDYLAAALGGVFAGISSDTAALRFDALLADPLRVVGWHSLFMAFTVLIVSRGLHRGIERAATILMPGLFVMLLVLTGYSAIAGDFEAGLRYMFALDFSKVDARVILAAIGQSFFSIGVGMGLMMTYGAYLSPAISIPRTATVIACADTAVALLAGLVVFPLVFSNDLAPAEGAGLVFVTLPITFGNMPAGTLFGGLFFLLLLFAALTSSVAIIEPLVSWAEEHRRIGRPRGALLAGLAAWTLGLLSALSFNVLRDVHPLGMFESLAGRTWFDLLDGLTAEVMMPAAGMLVALYAGWFLARESARAELHLDDGPAYRLWRGLIRTVVPLAIAALLVMSLVPG